MWPWGFFFSSFLCLSLPGCSFAFAAVGAQSTDCFRNHCPVIYEEQNHMPEVLNRDKRLFWNQDSWFWSLLCTRESPSQLPSHFEDGKWDFCVCRGLGQHTVFAGKALKDFFLFFWRLEVLPISPGSKEYNRTWCLLQPHYEQGDQAVVCSWHSTDLMIQKEVIGRKKKIHAFSFQ